MNDSTHSGWFDSCKNVDSSKNLKKITKPLKYNYKILSGMCLVYYNKWKMQFVSNGFNILKVNGSILIIENMWKKSQIHSNINVGFTIATYVLINYVKYKMQLLRMVSTC
jgi:hypothetical protein